MRFDQLKVGEKYITDHDTPIVITDLKDVNGWKEVWAEWPSKKKHQVKKFEDSIVKHYSLHVGDQIALERDGKFYFVDSITEHGMKLQGSIFHYSPNQITICKIKKRKLVPGDVIWTQGNDNYEYLVHSVFAQDGSFAISGSRKRGSAKQFSSELHKRLVAYSHLVGPVNCHTFKTEKNKSDNPCYEVDIDPVSVEDMRRQMEAAKCFGRLEPIRLTHTKPELTPIEWFNQIGKNLTYPSSQTIKVPKIPGTVLAKPITFDYCDTNPYVLYVKKQIDGLSELAKQHNVPIITGEQKMKITDFDKDNLKAGKEDALAKKKQWEREQADQAYTQLLNQLDSINTRMKILEAEKKIIETEMAKFG
jgi:hypothetical protein